MELGTRLEELKKRLTDHREVLQTEEAAKNALVMPFITALGYDVFNPAEVVPEFTADAPGKKGEKVDYAIRTGGKISILIECKPIGAQLNVKHAEQLFRYFTVTEARLAILTNGAVYQFYSDVDKPNIMDDKPFFSFTLDSLRPTDVRTLETFTKAAFDIDRIIREAVDLKLQHALRSELKQEFSEPSEEFIRMLTARVYPGKIMPAVKERFGKLITESIDAMIQEMVTGRISAALTAVSPAATPAEPHEDPDQVITTEEELSGYHIVKAIASRYTHPSRIKIRDAKAYCAILLDDNNRKTLVRLHFNAIARKYVGTFKGKAETKHLITDLTDIYQLETLIAERIRELDQTPLADLQPEDDGASP